VVLSDRSQVLYIFGNLFKRRKDLGKVEMAQLFSTQEKFGTKIPPPPIFVSKHLGSIS
jgi:hypothetical protein